MAKLKTNTLRDINLAARTIVNVNKAVSIVLKHLSNMNQAKKRDVVSRLSKEDLSAIVSTTKQVAERGTEREIKRIASVK